MLASNECTCGHPMVLPASLCFICADTAPDTLVDLCFKYILTHLDTICVSTNHGSQLKLKDSIVFPNEICDRFVELSQKYSPNGLNNKLIGIFRDRFATRLKRISLRNSSINDNSLNILLQHHLTDLALVDCRKLTAKSLPEIEKYGNYLTTLTIGEGVYIIPGKESPETPFDEEQNISCSLNLPNLRRFALRSVEAEPIAFQQLLLPMVNLTHLDLSESSDVGDLTCIVQMHWLVSLVLYNVPNIQSALPNICRIKSLRLLDISQSQLHENEAMFEDENNVLAMIVQSLPLLTSLDISGTNLAGTGVAERSSLPFSDIPGLSGRACKPLQFLGLYGTAHAACRRHDIPALMISGDASEQQILVAATVYSDRADILQRVLNDLYHLFRYETCQYIGHALGVVLQSMDRHYKEKHIQISGSATLFYIVKGKEKNSLSVNVKRHIITTLLNAMYEHKDDDTMMRNGCLTLCQFKIPLDVLFEYERLVKILLHSVSAMGFVQRVGIYLLNSLACQVDGNQKKRLGDLGAISKMLLLIGERLEQGVCDDVLEVAWSTMWNVTDETPINCTRFLEANGMDLFLGCLSTFPNKEELLRNMMGLLGNVAEVRHLRRKLMTTEYIDVFSALLDSDSDGIEVSYNAAGVLAHIASDGFAVWTISTPRRQVVLSRMVAAIERWDLTTERNINYRSFEPILNLVRTYHTKECQHWAVWALANLTKVYPGKYCSLVEAEGGLALLSKLIQHEDPPIRVKQLAQIVIENCRRFKERGYVDDAQLDG